MTIEMSIVGSLCLLASISKSPDGEAIRQHGFFYGWTPLTLVMIFLLSEVFLWVNKMRDDVLSSKSWLSLRVF